jgi:hypothetical protein
MSSIDNTSIDNNKDFDNNGDTKIWSEHYVSTSTFRCEQSIGFFDIFF